MREDIKKRIDAVRCGEVPDGYIETMAGTIPSAWSSAPLLKISDVLSEQAGERELETLSISAGIGFVNQAEKFGKELSGKQYSKYTVIRKGDFAYNKGNSKRYPQGCTYMLRERNEAAVPNVFECFRITRGDPEYYEQLFVNGFMNKQLTRKINHGVRDDGLLNLTDEDFYSTVLPVPPLADQHKIAEILSVCDHAIELKQQLLEEKRKRKQWLMKKLFNPDGNVRLGGTKNSGYTIYALGDICEIVKGQQLNKTNLTKEGDFYVLNGGVDPSGYTKKWNVEKNTISISEGGNSCGFVKFNIERFWSGGHNYTLQEIVADVNKAYLYHFLKNNEKSIMELRVGSGLPNIQKESLLRYKIVCPSVEEQEAVAEVLDVADKEIDLLKDELEEWQKKKKALMQLLLTGIVRVNA